MTDRSALSGSSINVSLPTSFSFQPSLNCWMLTEIYQGHFHTDDITQLKEDFDKRTSKSFYLPSAHFASPVSFRFISIRLVSRLLLHPISLDTFDLFDQGPCNRQRKVSRARKITSIKTKQYKKLVYPFNEEIAQQSKTIADCTVSFLRRRYCTN